MVPVTWAKPARDDLREIRGYIARDSTHYARITVEKIRAAAKRLGRFPLIGSVVRELPGEIYRQIVSGRYRIIYRFDSEKQHVYIVAVVHSARDLPTAMHGHNGDDG